MAHESLACCVLCRKDEELCECLQCEYCDVKITPQHTEAHTFEGRQYCSDDCRFDAEEDLRVGRIEAEREYEMWGTDYDSWYR